MAQMTPDRFQLRDLKRRMTRAEKQNDYRRSDLGQLAKRIRAAEDQLLKMHREIALLERFRIQEGH